MEFEEILENVTMDMVMEGIGLACSVGILAFLFMGGGMSALMELFVATLCGS